MENVLEVTRHVDLRRVAGIAFNTFQLLRGGASSVTVEQVMDTLPVGAASAEAVRNLLPQPPSPQ
jgi:hypothetical protein